MQSLIQISKINDFIFCPKSLYLHTIYENFSEKTYHELPQARGKIKHENIDARRYSTAKKYLQGLEVYSEEFGLVGKIDIFDTENKILIERKNKIKKIYDGYRYQLYAQYFCLREMGFQIDSIYLHSLSDNKRYKINIPSKNERAEFEEIIRKIRNFNPAKDIIVKNPSKCARCIYNNLCD